jgi:heat shock protein HslJ
MKPLTYCAPLLVVSALAACAPAESAAGGPAAAPMPVAALPGSSWQLAYFESSDDAIGRLIPPRLERYTVEFAADGAASFQLDCNRLSSRWTQTAASERGGSIAFAPGAMTRAFCGEAAMDTRIARDLAYVRSFTIVGDRLNLALEADAGIYVWTRRAGP